MATQDVEAALTAPTDEHPLIRRTRHALQKLDEQIADLERRRAEQKERTRRGLPAAILWGLFDDPRKEGGVIASSPGALSVMVTPAVRDRALAVMSTLIQLLQERNLRIWAPGATLIGRGKYAFVLRLSEIAEKAASKRIGATGTINWRATGRLRITLRDGPTGDFRVRDEANSSIEHQLRTLVDYVEQAIGRAPELQRQRDLAIQSRLAEAEKLATVRAEAKRVEAERQRLLSEENARRDELMSEMARWHDSQQLRAYVDAVLSHPGIVQPRSSVDQWARWARRIADEVDPIRERLEKLEGLCPPEELAE